jgi:hypothetical protein
MPSISECRIVNLRRLLAISRLSWGVAADSARPAAAAILSQDVVLYHAFDGRSPADYALGKNQHATVLEVGPEPIFVVLPAEADLGCFAPLP